ncbi:MAG: iron chaperone [Chitinophagales bacterium]
MKPKNIDEYIEMAPGESREKLRQMHACIRAAAPGAKEGLKWGMPAYSYKRILVTFAVFKHHIGFYPTPSAVKAFVKSLTKFKTASGSIQLPLEKPLPLSLISKITKFRVKESLEADMKWRS